MGNLAYRTDESALTALFGQHGSIGKAEIVLDRDTGRSRGFGFVEMDNDDEGRKAVAELDGVEFDGRRLTVNEARPRGPRGGDGGGGGGGYGGGGGGGGGGRGGSRW